MHLKMSTAEYPPFYSRLNSNYFLTWYFISTRLAIISTSICPNTSERLLASPVARNCSKDFCWIWISTLRSVKTFFSAMRRSTYRSGLTRANALVSRSSTKVSLEVPKLIIVVVDAITGLWRRNNIDLTHWPLGDTTVILN